MIKAKSKIRLEDKYSPVKEHRIRHESEPDIWGCCKITFTYEKRKNIYCEVNDILTLIFVSMYVHKPGCFYLAQNTKGEVFMIDEKDVEI